MKKTRVLLLSMILVVGMLFTTSYGQVATGVSHWSFDLGTTISDSWGSNDGTTSGINGILEFDGTGFITVGASDLPVPWTAAMRVQYDPESSHNAVLLSSDKYAIKVEQYNDTAKVGYTEYSVEDYIFDYSVTPKEWVHLAFVGTSSGVKLYANGLLIGEKSEEIKCPMNRIGAGNGTDGILKGLLDDVKIYDRALSSDEVAELAGVEPPVTPTLSLASEILINKGFQVQTWATTDDTGRYVLSPDDFDEINFTAPTYYEAPMYNSDYHASKPSGQWSLAKAPFGEHLSTGPSNGDHFLSVEQRANLDSLVTMCFGDEEGYSTSMVNKLKSWYDLSKSHYPNALVHNNQWGGQWKENDLRSYLQTAKPDLLTFDTYYFDQTETAGYQIANRVANDSGVYRKLALEGHDGSGKSPITWGQYLTGFKTGNSGYQAGNYVVSQSQINLVPFMTAAMGGKWVNMFRWAMDKDFCLIYDANGNKTESFHHYANMAEELRNIGPHLTRLNNSAIYMVTGQHKSGNQNIDNPLPNAVPAWQSSADDYITDISVENIGTVNNQLAGNVMVSYFDILPALPDSMKDVFTSDNPEYFMLTNCLINNDGISSSEKTLGSSNDSKQRITLSLDLGTRSPDTLKRVSRTTGLVEDVTLTPVSGTTYSLQVEIGGGKGDLFFWE